MHVLKEQENSTEVKGTGPLKMEKNKSDMAKLFNSGIWYLLGII